MHQAKQVSSRVAQLRTPKWGAVSGYSVGWTPKWGAVSGYSVGYLWRDYLMTRQRPSNLAREDVAAPVRPVEGSGTRFRHGAATDVRDIHEVHAGEG